MSLLFNPLVTVLLRSMRARRETGWKLEELQSKLRTQNTVLRSLMLKLHAPFLSTFLRGNKGKSWPC
jgi:hypothetical protein